MGKKTITSSFIIGVFVLSGITLFIFAVIWFGKDEISEEAKYYATYFDTSVDGLTTGTAVKYQGIDCGSITDLSIAPDGKLIEVVMQINPELEVDEELRAQASMSGIAGGKYILLFFPKSKAVAGQYPKLSFPSKYPRIKSAPSEFSEITAGTQDIVNRLTKIEYIKISERLYTLLDTMVTVAESTNRLMANDDVYAALINLNQASAELTGILRKVDSLSIYSEMERTAYNLDLMSKNILALSEKLDNKVNEIEIQEFLAGIQAQVDTTAGTANAAIDNIGYQSLNVMYGLTEIIEEFKITNKELQRTLRAFNESPTHTLFSNPPKED